MWVKLVEDASHESSVNTVAWAPHTFGLCLAAGSADGSVSIFTLTDKSAWERKAFLAHKGGVNAVSWGPDIKTGALLALNAAATDLTASQQQQQQQQLASFKMARRIVTAGCDNRIRIWRMNESDGSWTEQKVFANNDNAHADWVRDVAWAPSLGLPANTIASCSEDKTVIIWTEDSNGIWKKTKTLPFKTKVWKVSWSIMGNILAVSQGDNKVSLWKEALDGEWKNLSEVRDAEKDDKKDAKPAADSSS